jgi:hypothetical protein
MMRFLAALVAIATTSPAQATETWRMALVVGNNNGSGVRPALRYAEDDAGKVARVLVELGGFRREDVHLLTGRPLDEVMAALEAMKRTIGAWHASGRRVVVLFYFSGHSDGQVLELGEDHWAFSELRAGLGKLGAEIRLAIVDSCRSGALLAEKGGTPGPAFDIRFIGDLATSGEAVLTSSAADELALESREIRASFFSHHLVSGLRGAADTSGDGRVTLIEAYNYAFVNTLLATSGTLNGPQHPAYDLRMSGQGDMVLTEVAARGASLSLPDGFDRILIADGERRTLMAELTSESAHRIALPPGQYVVQARRKGRTFEARVALGERESRTIGAADLIGTTGTASVIKGDEPIEVLARSSVGVVRGAASALPWLAGFRAGVHVGRRLGWMAELELSTGRTSSFRESGLRAVGGLFLASNHGRFRTETGWRLTSGPLIQQVDGGARFWTWASSTGPFVSGELALSPGIRLCASVGLDAAVLRRDGAPVVTLWPSAFAGFELGL